MNKEGGANSVTLQKNQMPSHNHNGNGGNTSSGEYGLIRHAIHGETVTVDSVDVKDSDKQPDLTATPMKISIQTDGANKPHENRPLYYTLAFLIKI